MAELTCKSCAHYRAGGYGALPYCTRGVTAYFPSRTAQGRRCGSFSYEPGSDEDDSANATTAF